MPAIPTVGGVAYFWAGGRQLRVRGDFKLQPNNFQYEGVSGQDGVHGRKKMPVTPTVEANISDEGTLSLQDMAAMVMKPSRSNSTTARPTTISRHGIPASPNWTLARARSASNSRR
jgi:hypothetical protein